MSRGFFGPPGICFWDGWRLEQGDGLLAGWASSVGEPEAGAYGFQPSAAALELGKAALFTACPRPHRRLLPAAQQDRAQNRGIR